MGATSSSSSSAAPTTTTTSAAPTTTTTSAAPSTTTTTSAAPSTTTTSAAPSTTSTSSSSAAPTTSSTRSSTTTSSASTTTAAPTTTSATTTAAPTSAAPAPSGSIVNPVSPAGSNNAFCSALRLAPQFKLRSVVTRGNRALDGLFLQVPTYASVVSPPRLVSGVANGGRYVQTNSVNWANVLPSIASVTATGTCSAAGLALYNSNSEQGATGLVPNLGTASTVDIGTTTNYVFPFQLFQFGSFYACSATGGATLRWIQNNPSNFYGALYQTLDLNNCALIQLQKVIA